MGSGERGGRKMRKCSHKGTIIFIASNSESATEVAKQGQSFPKETLLAITAEVQSGQAEDKDFVVSAARLLQLLQPDTVGGQPTSSIIL